MININIDIYELKTHFDKTISDVSTLVKIMCDVQSGYDMTVISNLRYELESLIDDRLHEALEKYKLSHVN